MTGIPVTWVLGWSAPQDHRARNFVAGQMRFRIIGDRIFADRELYMTFLLQQRGWSPFQAQRMAQAVLAAYPGIAEDEVDWMVDILAILSLGLSGCGEDVMVRMAMDVLRFHYGNP